MRRLAHIALVLGYFGTLQAFTARANPLVPEPIPGKATQWWVGEWTRFAGPAGMTGEKKLLIAQQGSIVVVNDSKETYMFDLDGPETRTSSPIAPVSTTTMAAT